MSIGATLAAARGRAGLTVGEVSQRTRVRENIIQGIERDDFAACGGGFYARGHIRAIADAVGTDPVPLIEEFDETRGSARRSSRPKRSGRPCRSGPRTAPGAVGLDAGRGGAGRDRLRVYKAVSGVIPAHGRQSPSLASGVRPPVGQPSSAPAGTASLQGSTSPSARHGRIGGSLDCSSRAPRPARSPPAPDRGPRAGLRPGRRGRCRARGAGRRRRPSHPMAHRLVRHPDFGVLYSGTGLLVDLGRPVTVTSVRLSLGPRAPASSCAPETSRRRPACARGTSAKAGAAVELALTTPAHARYLLIWFTNCRPTARAPTRPASIRSRSAGSAERLTIVDEH